VLTVVFLLLIVLKDPLFFTCHAHILPDTTALDLWSEKDTRDK